MNEETLSKLERLNKLREQGAITQQEFDQQKRVLMGGTVTGPRPAVKNKLSWWKVALGVFFGGTILSLLVPPDEKKSAEMKATMAERDSARVVNESIRKVSNDVDVAYLKAARAIKRNLKDPDSFQEIDHRSAHVDKKGIYISCLMTYRAKNGFGGYGVEKALVNFNDKMEAIDVIPVK